MPTPPKKATATSPPPGGFQPTEPEPAPPPAPAAAPPAAHASSPAPAFVDVGAAEVAEGGAFVPVEGQLSRTATPATRVGSCPPFLLRAHPQRWTVSGGAVIPLFGKIKLEGGLNGADDVRDRTTNKILRANVGMARAASEEAGWVTIPYHAIPASHRVPELHNAPGTQPSYVWRPKGRPDVHLLIYERCYPGSERIDRNDARFIEFCQHLVDSGVIAPAPLYVLRHMLEDARQKAMKWVDIAAKNPHTARIADQMQANVRVLEEAIAARETPAMDDSELPPATGESFALEGA